jgi:predicted amidophosphoribosyltransferase
LIFFSGIALIITGGILLLVGRSRHLPQGGAPLFPAAATTGEVPPVVTSVPPPTTTGKFCMNCGATLPAHVAFCNKCGFKQTSPVKPRPQTPQQDRSQSIVRPTEMIAREAPTKFCRYCGAKITRDSKYCEECGTPLARSNLHNHVESEHPR